MNPILLVALSVIGLLNAAYLSYTYLFQMGACAEESSCSEVLGSAYAALFGIPLSAYGLGANAAFLVFSWRALEPDSRDQAVGWISTLSIPAVLVGLYLTYVQGVVIGAWCPFCLLSFAVSIALLVLSVQHRRITSTLSPLIPSLASRHLIPPVLALILIPTAYARIHARIGSSPAAAHVNGSEVIAKIREREITAHEVDHANRLKMYQMRNGYRQEWIDRELLGTAAAEKGMDVRAFVQQDIYTKVEVTQAEIDKRYNEIKDRIPANVSKASIERNIRNEIGNRKSKIALDAYIRDLEARYGAVYTVPASERFAFDSNPRGGPEKGAGPDAPITIVEFSDLECHYCARAHAYLGDLLKRRGDEIRVVFKHLPLERHRHARRAAEIAACVQKQEPFWSLADSLFGNQDELVEAKVFNYAAEVGADTVAVRACLEAGIGKQIVDADIAEADALGVSSTPTFFVNGHYVGPLPEEGLEPLIEKELKYLGQAN